MSKYWELEVTELRAVIEGRRTYKRCPNCVKGKIFYSLQDFLQDEPDLTEEDYDPEEYIPCENCHELGYVVAIWEDDD